VTLQSCLASIRQQDLRQFEILAINDNSSDSGVALVKNWPDSRIRLLDHPGSGLVSALNFGLRHARYPLVARMDADDLMRSTRLSRQLNFMQKNPDIDLAGSCVSLFPSSLVQAGYREYIRWQNAVISENDIANNLFVESPLAHPSVIFRRDTVLDAGGYLEGDFPEDYELWLRLIKMGARLGKHPDTLLDWRESDGRLSRNHPAYYRSAFDTLRARYLAPHPALHVRPVAFWGAGRKTRLRARHLIDLGIQPWRWIDIDPKKIGNRINGIEVAAPACLMPGQYRQKPFVLVYVTNHGARDLIEAELTNMDYNVGKDFLCVG